MKRPLLKTVSIADLYKTKVSGLDYLAADLGSPQKAPQTPVRGVLEKADRPALAAGSRLVRLCMCMRAAPSATTAAGLDWLKPLKWQR